MATTARKTAVPAEEAAKPTTTAKVTPAKKAPAPKAATKDSTRS